MMKLTKQWFPLLVCSLALISIAESRRVRVRPLPSEEEEDTVQYYAADPQEAGEQRVVYISAADQYNGLYGQPSVSDRRSQENYIPSRNAPSPKAVSKTKESSKQPPVQTIRNYNKVNDDGSFTFGYEAADGSFKEETRGTDCVVRGKYGYVDPDGNKREFTYVSGNPCDPNAPKDEEVERGEEERPEADSGPANYPTRPIRPIRPVTVAPKPVTLFQNNYAQGQEEEEPEPEQILRQQPQHVRSRPTYLSRPRYEEEEPTPIYQRQRVVPSTTPASVIYKHSVIPLSITPRPVTASTTRQEQEATTYRPQLLQVAVTPRPALLYTKQIASPRPTLSSLRGSGNIDFDAEFQKFQQENNIVAPTPTALSRPTGPAKSHVKQQTPSGQIYSSELVYDPSSGQYKTQLYQTLPQTEGDFTLSHRIQPYVHQQQSPLLTAQQLQNQSPLYRHLSKPTPTPLTNNQALYQQQQSELQFQNSAQLYAQQQKVRQQQTAPQQFYYLQPQSQAGGYQPQGGQIDAFLRGHNIQF